MFLFMPWFIFFVLSWSKYIVCFFLRRSEEELMAVKETHKEPERLTDKVSAFDSAFLFSQFYFISMSKPDFWRWPVF